MSAREHSMSAHINMSARPGIIRGYRITARANKTALCGFPVRLPAEAAKLDAAIDANLEEQGHGE